MQTVGELYRNVHVDSRVQWMSDEGPSGESSPFPMNKSFRPPPPIHDATREMMWKLFQEDPNANSQLVLSRNFGISLKRVDAILRLKGLENALREQDAAEALKEKPKRPQVQTGFQRGMDRLLGAHMSREPDMHGSTYSVYYDQTEADQLELEENRDAQRQRYVRMYWESIPEDGREPVVPASLKHAHETAMKYSEKAERAKQKLVPRIPETFELRRPEKFEVVDLPNRTPLEFKDVGAKFINVERELQRLRQGELKRRKRASSRARAASPPPTKLS